MNKMSEAYKTVYIGDTAEIVEKKSRFIANLEHVESDEEDVYKRQIFMRAPSLMRRMILFFQ